MTPRTLLLAGLLGASLLLAPPATAGTVCGTVRDATTNAPVAQAGVFVRTTAGAYTGYAGGTAADGSFCIDGIPAGTYDLEVRRDDYVVAYLRGVVVTASAVDVSLLAGPSVELALPAPNPAVTSTRIAWTLPQAAHVRVRILDLAGRLVRTWDGDAPAGSGALAWDLRDAFGRAVRPGLYRIMIDALGQRKTRTVVHLP